MEISLKGPNTLGLLGLMVANLAVFYSLTQYNEILTENWVNFASSYKSAFPAGLGLALTGILNAQLSPTTKARIVFMRWENALPGCEAFTRHALNDPRINLTALEQAYGPFPTDPRKQNELWYQLYKSIRSDPAVTQVHRAFLFARDYTGLALMMGLVLGIAGYFQIPSTGTALAYIMVLGLQFLLAGQAARNHGKRFVTTVLALKSTGQ
ncbi:MAG: hypothetical protein KC643_29985 [Nitrospira sp.]|nr:hypothetical protein [Nitrospira sp.]